MKHLHTLWENMQVFNVMHEMDSFKKMQNFVNADAFGRM
jgi:hypothetical protein